MLIHLNNTNPVLGPLDNYGGPTPTVPLLAGSPAIDGGSTALAPAADQRGHARPFGAAADTIGRMFATPEFWSALAAIVVIDLVLAGDNAIVIALAARNLPKAVQRRAIVWGTVGAVAVRASLTVAVLWLR